MAKTKIDVSPQSGQNKEVLSREKVEGVSLETPVEAPSESKEREAEKEDLTLREIQELRDKIEKTDLEEHLKIQAAAQAADIKSLKKEEKIKKLLEIAKKKGIVYAVSVARKMNDPYILDTFHDTLAEKGYYKSFLKE